MFKRKMLFLLLLAFLAPTVFAQENVPALNFSKEEANAEMTVIADISIRDFKILSQENNKFSLSFGVENAMEIQSDLVYGVELIKKVDAEKVIFSDSKAYPEDRLTVAKEAPIKREIIYQAPNFLSGEYELWLKIKDESGLVLSLRSLEVTLTGTNNFVELSNPCYLTIEGETEKYSLIQGVDLKPEEKIFLECQAENKSTEKVTVSPRFEIYLRDSFSSQKQIGNIAEETFEFNPQESKLIKIPLILSSQPQAYDVKTELMKKNGSGYILFSNPIFSHLVIVGKSGTINSADLDKDFYQKGETAKISYLANSSADGFRNSRHGGSGLQEPILKVEMKNSAGQLCGAKMEEKNPNFQAKTTLSLAITQECRNPQVLLELFDGQNKLYEKKLNVITQVKDEIKAISPEKKSSDKLFLIIWLTLGGLFLLAVLFLLIRKRKNSQFMGIFFLSLVLSGGLFLAGDAKADPTVTVTGAPRIISRLETYIYDASWTYPSVCSVNNQCALLLRNRTYPCIDRDDPKKIRTGDVAVGGCYQDIATFTYSLNKTSFTTGETASAYAYAHGDMMCGNGITSGALVSPKNDNSKYNIFTSNLTEGAYTSTSAKYDFNVGTTANTFTARFYLGMEHGADKTLDDGTGEEVWATGDIQYTVTAPITYSCTGNIPSGSTMCSGDDSGLTSNLAWQYAGTSSANCTSGRKCEYYTPPASTYSCTGNIPSGSTMCSGDDSGLTSNLAWQYAGTSSANCTSGRKCEYYTPVVCVSTGCPSTCSDTCSGTSCGTDNCGTACYGSKACSYNPTLAGSCDENARISLNWTTYNNQPSNGTFDIRIDDRTNNASGATIDGWYVPNTTDLIYNNYSASSHSYPYNYYHQGAVGVNYYRAWIHDRRFAPDSANISAVSIFCTCGGAIPAGSSKCPGTKTINHSAPTDWHSVPTCTVGNSCEYTVIPLPINNSSCVSMTGVPASIIAGETFTAQVTVQNTGTKTWNSDSDPHRLGSQNPENNSVWGLNRVGLPVASVAPGAQTTFSFSATAPATPATYSFDWRMVEDFKEWFGPTCSTNVIVTPACTPSCNTSENTCATLGCGEHYKYNCTPTCAPSDCAGNPKCTEKLQCPCNSGNWRETGE
jgi:hypothetical protein